MNRNIVSTMSFNFGYFTADEVLEKTIMVAELINSFSESKSESECRSPYDDTSISFERFRENTLSLSLPINYVGKPQSVRLWELNGCENVFSKKTSFGWLAVQMLDLYAYTNNKIFEGKCSIILYIQGKDFHYTRGPAPAKEKYIPFLCDLFLKLNASFMHGEWTPFLLRKFLEGDMEEKFNVGLEKYLSEFSIVTLPHKDKAEIAKLPIHKIIEIKKDVYFFDFYEIDVIRKGGDIVAVCKSLEYIHPWELMDEND